MNTFFHFLSMYFEMKLEILAIFNIVKDYHRVHGLVGAEYSNNFLKSNSLFLPDKS